MSYDSLDVSRDTRLANLERAMAVRKERAAIKKRVGTGELSVADVIDMDSEAASRMRVIDLLASRRGYGKKRSLKLMRKLKISERRRVRGLGMRQREALLKALGSDM